MEALRGVGYKRERDLLDAKRQCTETTLFGHDVANPAITNVKCVHTEDNDNAHTTMTTGSSQSRELQHHPQVVRGAKCVC
eukprot:scaffold625_cov324-Pavlova_lutheri.AAC.130